MKTQIESTKIKLSERIKIKKDEPEHIKTMKKELIKLENKECNSEAEEIEKSKLMRELVIDLLRVLNEEITTCEIGGAEKVNT